MQAHGQRPASKAAAPDAPLEIAMKANLHQHAEALRSTDPQRGDVQRAALVARKGEPLDDSARNSILVVALDAVRSRTRRKKHRTRGERRRRPDT
jgi:hypothetical protein